MRFGLLSAHAPERAQGAGAGGVRFGLIRAHTFKRAQGARAGGGVSPGSMEPGGGCLSAGRSSVYGKPTIVSGCKGAPRLVVPRAGPLHPQALGL